MYECEKNRHQKEWLAGFEEPCTGSRWCGNETRKIVSYGGEKEWEYTFHPDYKTIPRSKMRKSEDCLRQEREDRESNEKEASRLRKEASELLLKARDLDN
jgi:hypothetical protein